MCFKKVSCCCLQVNRINIGIMTSAAILCMLHVLSHVSPSGLTSNVIVEVVGSPCLVVGTDVTLQCQPDGVPRSRVTWFQNVRPLSSDSDYRISDYPDFTLTITNVVSSDAGSYTCEAENTLTNGTSSETVTKTFNDFSMACGEFAVNVHIFVIVSTCCCERIHAHIMPILSPAHTHTTHHTHTHHTHTPHTHHTHTKHHTHTTHITHTSHTPHTHYTHTHTTCTHHTHTTHTHTRIHTHIHTHTHAHTHARTHARTHTERENAVTQLHAVHVAVHGLMYTCSLFHLHTQRAQSHNACLSIMYIHILQFPPPLLKPLMTLWTAILC